MSVCEELPPPDTVLGSLKFAGGKPASVSISFAGSVLRFSLSVTGTKGSLEASYACNVKKGSETSKLLTVITKPADCCDK